MRDEQLSTLALECAEKLKKSLEELRNIRRLKVVKAVTEQPAQDKASYK